MIGFASGSVGTEPMRTWWTFLISGWLLACAESPVGDDRPDASGPVLLVNHGDWEALAPDEDAFPSHRPAAIQCAESALFQSLDILELEMNLCNYVAVSQPLRVDIAAGEVVRFPLWHLQLFAPEPAEAHLALVLGDDLLVEYVAPIPSPPYIETRDITLTRDYPAGTVVQLHLHNHGENHYRIGPIEVMR